MVVASGSRMPSQGARDYFVIVLAINFAMKVVPSSEILTDKRAIVRRRPRIRVA